MLTFIICLVLAAFVGIYGWAQIVGSIQHMKEQKYLIITLILWALLMYAVAYIMTTQHNSLIACLIGYAISFYIIFINRNNKVEE